MITLIGDVHDQIEEYAKIVKDIDHHTVQLGDMGERYHKLDGVDPNLHKFIAGNHEYFPKITPVPNYLGRYGSFVLDDKMFFFCGGAGSIDKAHRIPGRNWFPDEDVSFEQGEKIIEYYKETKPDVCLTHTAPRSIVNQISNPDILKAFGLPVNWSDTTSIVLEECFRTHQPTSWYFGHFHMSKSIKCNNTHFQCVNILEKVTIE